MQAPPAIKKGSKGKPSFKNKKFGLGMSLDTDAINEEFTFGGEQGKKNYDEEEF